MSTQPRGVHLVGSINLGTTSDVFTQIPPLLAGHLRRLPDGEPAPRNIFTRWQKEVAASAPEVLLKRDERGYFIPGPSGLNPSQVSSALEKLQTLHTGYDDYALESYALFKQRKDEGIIPPHICFQVCLPGLVNVMTIFATDFQQALEPRYEDALTRSLNRIQDSIPHSDLAIQIDAAIEFAYLEGVEPLVPYFDPVFPGVVDRLSRFANRVAPDVELGFHLCYGDLNHRHFIEPKDMGLLVKVANALHKEVGRSITWLHMPVPKGRTDREYYAPLQGLEWEGEELHLGLVHEGDEEGTRERIEMARSVLGERGFGVATECGMGRTPVEHFGNIMETLRSVSAPVA
ncbi:hypothetical protein BU26DRAFT_518639 [Trematosphaeria pertusa]|uniref:UROD/MetE-like protein n=1 Tax=Trematosphaeria pertusa TaxID=390896 RepID=A0A6A6IK16_9PLEO|nr:uncharacterized protein BU26DRAFT_518639 [Trematosphaeria pertusa]KAF2250222.1 hypothetical protein BU26DRAFT_518639 [Trematosphaeria pertusa]